MNHDYTKEIEGKEQQIRMLESEISQLKAHNSKELSWHQVYNAIYQTFIIEQGYQAVSHSSDDLANHVSWKDKDNHSTLRIKGVMDKLFPELES